MYTKYAVNAFCIEATGEGKSGSSREQLPEETVEYT